MPVDKSFDVIVIGAGHAGIEAALAAARMGARTALITISRDKIGEMSCNPAIGGIAKGQLVREIDALGGEMARAADKTCIQFKVLNSTKGPAVRGLRAQADKAEYRSYMSSVLLRTGGLTLIEDMASGITSSGSSVTGVTTESGTRFDAGCVIITTGTFLNGILHTGLESFPGGRRGDPASTALSGSLVSLGLKPGRMKTGTPPRVSRASLDFSKFTVQPGDKPPSPFSFSTGRIDIVQEDCWLARTNEGTNAVINENLDKSPLYSPVNRKIFSIGPRYCPSIEDKVVKFPGKTSHPVFIEPEYRNSDEMYLNGLSTSLPLDVQYAYLRTIPGFENVKIVQPAYAIEYDFFPPHTLLPSLESKLIQGLFFAGQVNGTSGYEEAAAQGLVAGINAALKLRGEAPFMPGREESYIGVMIDDIINNEINEPYRLFSSRAEYRLLLRNDNADIRLAGYGRKAGLVSDEAYKQVEEKRLFLKSELTRLSSAIIHPSPAVDEALAPLGVPPVKEPLTALKLLKRPGVSYGALKNFTGISEGLPAHFTEFLDAEVKYEGYIKKQLLDISSMKKLNEKEIPPGFDYSAHEGLSLEAKQKLNVIKPATIGAASRISGVTPSDISVLLVLLKKYGREGGGQNSLNL
ncbi:MAG TPA: tRNA uridine-5-carboxymethylaminomethyl(34) synthesis enzyme MnmG [bacterium]|nr:tRNA uridine-5-carboxymethylaminomethyl(34) synthesis enzyme MnmG [bacterium]